MPPGRSPEEHHDRAGLQQEIVGEGQEANTTCRVTPVPGCLSIWAGLESKDTTPPLPLLQDLAQGPIE